MARFRREAQAAGRLTHPHVVAIYEFGEDAGTHFIAMEFVGGQSLKHHFEQNARFTVPQIVRIMSQLLEALGYSHRHGVVHRDIKPANVMLLDDGTVKVADFGIARIESSNLTQTGMILGTPSYMSPEQFMGQIVDGRSDLFSAGVILYQLLTGERPFSGSPTTIMHKVLTEEPLPPSTLNVQAPRPFDQVVKHALDKRPDGRYQTAREFADAIRAAVEGRAAPAPEATVLSTARRAEPTLVAPPTERTQRIERTARQPAPGGASAAAARRSQWPAIAVLGGVAALGVAVAAWFALSGSGPHTAGQAPVAAAPPAQAALPPPPPATATPAPETPPPATPAPHPGTLLVTAVGIADPDDARYRNNSAHLQDDLRADSRSQAVEKALGLYLERASLAKNYDLLRDKLLSRSASFIADVLQESEPQVGKDGFAWLTTKAVVNVKALQKSLNQMSREERIEFIRAHGDPKVEVRITVRDADRPDAPAQASPIAENLLKARIKSFGFRTWSEESGGGGQAKSADFTVIGEARVKRLSAKLAASGITITKFTLSSWTVKCVDRGSGEEIHFNTALPKGIGSWASEEEALAAIGTKVADEFSRDFFLQNFPLTGQKVVLKFEGLPDAVPGQSLGRELAGLAAVLSATARAGGNARVYDAVLAGPGAVQDILAAGVLRPLNAKLGQACFRVGASAAGELAVGFDPACADPSIVGRLESNPPAALYAAPAARLKSVVKNPETLKKLLI
jgi:serine/threonine-protein kinase